MQASNRSESNAHDNDFPHEVRSQFQREIDLRVNLDSKVNNLITMSASIITALIALGSLLVIRINPRAEIFTTSIGIFIVGIVFASLAMLFFIKSYSIRKYRYPMGYEAFFDKSGNYLKDTVQQFTVSSKEKFSEHMVKEYILSIKNFAEQNADKSTAIRNGQTMLLVSSLSLASLLIFILISFGLNYISIL
jgi:hypothetical protein